jgi:hypothetical protein
LCLLTRRRYAGLLPPECTPDLALDAEAVAAGALFCPDFDPGTAVPPPAFALTPGKPPLPAESAPKSWAELLADADALFFRKPDSGLEQRLRACGVRNVTWIDPRPAAPPHAALRFLQAAGCTASDELLCKPLWPAPAPGGCCLWLHPGSGSPAKNWPIASFAELACAWQSRHDGEVIVSFGEADAGLESAVTRELTRGDVRWHPVREVAAAELLRLLRKETALYIGNDSGVTHLAGAAGLPTVALFRATDPVVWRPLGNCTVFRDGQLDRVLAWLSKRGSCRTPW